MKNKRSILFSQKHPRNAFSGSLSPRHGVASLTQTLHLPLEEKKSGVSMPSGCNIQLLPDGNFSSTDGRPGNLKDCNTSFWRLDQNIAARLIEDMKRRETPLVVDYEHQTLCAKTNGKPAPAAGFFSTLTYLPNRGLFTHVNWTKKAKDHITAGEYLYISPVFTFCRDTGAVTGLLHAALTNTPALDGMTAVAAASLYSFFPASPVTLEDQPMDDLLARLRLIFNLPDADQEEIAALLDELYNQLATYADAENPVDLMLFIKSIRSLEQTEEGDEAVVPLRALTGLQHEIAALSGQMASLKAINANERVKNDIATAMSDGRLPRSLKSWAQELSRTNPHVLRTFLDNAKPIAALTSMQTKNMQKSQLPEAEKITSFALSEEEHYAAKQLGIHPQDFATFKHQGDK